MHCLCTPTLRAGRAFSLLGARHVASAARPAAPLPQQPRGPRPALYCPPPASALAVPYLPPEAIADPRFLRVAIVGEPNAGKSTLLNSFLGAPLSAVSRKCNTTRDRVLGVSTLGATQVAFTDTPGFVLPGSGGGSGGGGGGTGRYQRTLVAMARAQVPASDLVLLVVDIARRMTPEMALAMEDMVGLCGASGVPVCVAANKSDLLRGTPLSAEQRDIARSEGRRPAGDLLDLKLQLLQEWLEGACRRAGFLDQAGFASPHVWLPAAAGGAGAGAGAAQRRRAPSPYSPALLPVMPVAAGAPSHTPRDATGVDALLNGIRALAPRAPWHYGSAMVTDRCAVDTLADAVRGRLFECLHAEVPYRITQATRSWREVPLRGSWGTEAAPADAAALGGGSGAALRGLGGDDFQGAVEGGVEGGEGAAAAAGAPAPLWLSEMRARARAGAGASAGAGAASAGEQGMALLVHQDIIVPSARVAGMLLARGGGPIKAIAAGAAADLGRVLGKKVFLQLHVAVKAGMRQEE